MIKKITVLLFYCLMSLVVVYLLLPGSADSPPLPESRKSTEPGDTVEIPGLFAYYTNMERSAVVAFYQKYFSNSSFFGIPLLTYRLNHPPEYAWEVIRDTVHSSYLEEIVHPLRESLFINGFEPVNDPFRKNQSKLGNFELDGQEYKTKITVLRKDSNPILRLVIFLTAAFFLRWLAVQIKNTYQDIFCH